MLHTPRLTFAMAERGDFPGLFGLVHPQFKTPYISILLYTALLLGFTLAGNFRWNITLSAVARLFTYGSVAIALLILRKRRPYADAFRLPAGRVLAAGAMVFCVVLLVRAPFSNSLVLVITVVLAAINWRVTRMGLLRN
jgi:amino acid transporter